MTEQEAKQKWCPFARVIPFYPHAAANWQPPVGNRGDLPTSNKSAVNCIGSQCMAWRILSEADGGYCGLAGYWEDAP